MSDVRIYKLNPARLVASKPGHFGEEPLIRFNSWFSVMDRTGADGWYAWDFAWFDSVQKKVVWCYAPPAGTTDIGDFSWLDFPGGWYAAAISRDEDDGDGERVYGEIKEWIAAESPFLLDEQPGCRETMFHITTPPEAKAILGYHQMDIYVPIRPK